MDLRRWCCFVTIVVTASILAAGAGDVRAGASPRPGDERPVAVLILVSGPVKFQRQGKTFPGEFGANLEEGDVVVTGSGALAEVLFATRQIVEIGPESRIVIRTATSLAPDPFVGAEVVGEVPDRVVGGLARFAQSASGEEGLSALPELRAAEERIELLSPRRSLVKAGTIAFRWTEFPDVLEYRLTLRGPGSANGTHRTSATSWTLPEEHALRAGERWTWNIEALTPEGSIHSESHMFEVAPDSLSRAAELYAQRLQPLLTSGDPARADAARYLLGSAYRSLGFYSDAIPHYEMLVDRHPDRSELRRELGEIYGRVGLYERAARQFQSVLRN